MNRIAFGIGSVKSIFSSWLSAGLETLYPSECEVCQHHLGGSGPDGILPCSRCRDNLVFEEGPICPRCSAPAPAGSNDRCPRCRGQKLRFENTTALGLYQTDLRKAILRMKHRRSEPLAASIGHLLAVERGGPLKNCGIDLIVPVPMHWARRVRRGVSSPEVFARQMSRRLRIPALLDLLRCQRNIKQQSTLTRPQRFKNVHRAYRSSTGYDISGAHVLVMDDILTTGATANEAARALLAAGAAKVSVAVVARTANSEY